MADAYKWALFVAALRYRWSCSLIEAIVLVSEGGRLVIEVRGDLAAILALGTSASPAWGPGT